MQTQRTPTGGYRANETDPLIVTFRQWQFFAFVFAAAVFLMIHVRSHRGEFSQSMQVISDRRQKNDILNLLALSERQHVCKLATSVSSGENSWSFVQPEDILMPHPKAVYSDSNHNDSLPLVLSSFLKFDLPHISNEYQLLKVRNSISQFCNVASGMSSSAQGNFTNIGITISGKNTDNQALYNTCLKLGDEAYNITFFDVTSVLIQSCSINAVVHAMSSLTQLFAPGVIPVIPTFPFTIEDYPKYKWRGLMVDVSRHFQPVQLLKRCIDAMHLSKLNVLHLHITDAQSFPLLLDDMPGLPLSLLANRGSYDNKNKVYTKSHLKDLVSYARLRGIEIVPEIDVPAHTLAWGKAFPNIIVNCSNRASVSQSPMDIYTLDPSNALTYVVLESVLRQVAEIFPSKYLHVGGDEVDVRCWQESSSLQDWAKAQGNIDANSIFSDFMNKTFRIVRKLGKVPMTWEGIIDSSVMPSESEHELRSVVQPWKCWSGLAIKAANLAIQSNHPVVMSSCWYLDYDEDWLSMMSVDQLATTIARDDTNASSFAMGGEVAMWTERVDHTNLECRMWPRAAAIASRLWGFNDKITIATTNNTFHNILFGQTATLDIDSSKSLLIALVHFRSMLVRIGVEASEIVFHRAKNESTYELFPEGAHWTEQEAIEKIRSYLSVGITLTSNNKHQPNLVPGALRLSCHCVTASKPMAVQRPIHVREVSISQLNVADGRLGNNKYSLIDWFVEKANSGTILIGLCELNNWHKLKSLTDINHNRPMVEYYASQGGFTHSFVMSNSQPYNLGVISTLPFQVFGQFGPPMFQRGLLHVYIRKIKLHVIIVHLHAHDAKLRRIECKHASNIIAPLLANQSRVVVMGDFNTLSPLDAKQHQDMNLFQSLLQKNHDVWPRLAMKFLNSDRTEIDYEPMSIILNSGMMDSCNLACMLKSGLSTPAPWSISLSSPFSLCMQRYCAATEPTNFSAEWPALPTGEKHPFVRLDYILVSPAIVSDAKLTKRGNEIMSAFVERTNLTEGMSDHFPVTVRWSEKNSIDLF